MIEEYANVILISCYSTLRVAAMKKVAFSPCNYCVDKPYKKKNEKLKDNAVTIINQVYTLYTYINFMAYGEGSHEYNNLVECVNKEGCWIMHVTGKPSCKGLHN